MNNDLIRQLEANGVTVRRPSILRRIQHAVTRRHHLIPLYRYHLDASMSMVGFACDVCGYEA